MNAAGNKSTDSKAAIELPAPVINSVTGALDDLSCTMERLSALHWSNHSDLNDALSALPEGHAKESVYRYWMIFTTVGEKIDEVERIVVALTEAAYRQSSQSKGGVQ